MAHEGRRMLTQAERQRQRSGKDSHQQTGFATGTIADDDELATDLSHGIGVV
jgi:hypothetical protein